MNIPWYEILLYNRIGFINFWLTDLEESQKFYYQALTLIKEQRSILDTLALVEAFVLFGLNSSYKEEYHLDLVSEKVLIDSFTDAIFLTPGRKLKYHFLQVLRADTENDYQKLNSEIQQAENYLDNLPAADKFWPFVLRMYQGLYYKRIDDYNLAIRYFNELEQKVLHEKELKQFRYYVYINLLFLNSQLQRYKIAADYIQKLSYFLSSYGQQPFFYSDYVLIGEVYKNLGLYEEALASFKIAEEILTKNQIHDESLVFVYYYIAMYYKQVEHDQETMFKYLKMAEKIIVHCNSPYLETYIMHELGKYYYNQKDYDKAIDIFDFILNDAEQLLNNEKYFKTKYHYLSSSPYLNALHFRGASLFNLSRQKNSDIVTIEKSYSDYHHLLQLHEKMFREHGFEESKITSLKSIRNDLESIFEVGYALYELTKENSYLEDLFSFSEKSKAYMLKNYISDEQAKRISGIPEVMIEKARIMKKEIDTLQYSMDQRALQNIYAPDELIVNRILQKQEEYDNYIQMLEKKYPEYAQLKNRGTTISVYTVQKHLQPDQSLIEYFFTDTAFFSFYIDKDTILLTYQKVSDKLYQQVMEYRRYFDDLTFNKMNSQNIKEFIKKSYTLYSLTLKPIEDRIFKKRLIIIPDEALSLIPFETLIQKPPDSLEHTTLKKLPFLIMNNPVCYLYSASQISTRSKTHFKVIDYAGFAPTYTNLNSDSVTQNTGIPEPLPGAVDEVMTANRYFRGRVYIDPEINKDIYFKESRKRIILHLAMHALLDSIEPMNSKFIFSPAIDLDEKQLHAYEIYARKIVASLVVLSACNTGMGEMNEGEGIFSIARAYLLAGVQNVLYTQWSISDRSSTQLMDRFYFYLSHGVPTDIALQKAKIDFILQGDPVKTIPYYWAGYMIMGTPIRLPSQNIILFLAGLCALVMLVMILIYIRRERSTS
jgi:CHAT domain-containing protein